MKLYVAARAPNPRRVQMFLAEKTVKNYVSGILSKLGMQRRTQAAVLAAAWLPKDQQLR